MNSLLRGETLIEFHQANGIQIHIASVHPRKTSKDEFIQICFYCLNKQRMYFQVFNMDAFEYFSISWYIWYESYRMILARGK